MVMEAFFMIVSCRVCLSEYMLRGNRYRLVKSTMKKHNAERIIDDLDSPKKLIPLPFKTINSLSADILPYVRNVAIRRAMGMERSKMDGCRYRKALIMSVMSAPFPIKRRVSFTNFSIKRSIDMEKTMTIRFLNSSLNIAL
jgi:hypothetical protein